MSQLRQVFPQWYKNMSTDDLKKLIDEYNNLDLRKFDFTRKNIPKPGTDMLRPLGIPKPAWRLFQTGLNMLLLIWLKAYQHPNQHGFTPGRGTTSAWNHIHSDVIPSKYIYEFDLDKFFDRVNLDYLNLKLKEMGIPNDLVDIIINWSRMFPKEERHYFADNSIPDNTLLRNGKCYIQNPSTDLTWSSKEEQFAHLKQHNNLPINEFNSYN